MSISQPTCYINNTDVSDIINKTVISSGKNQPFMYIEVKIQKTQYNDEDYWIAKNKRRPDLVPGETVISIDTYGSIDNATIIKVNDKEDQYYTIVAVNNALRLKYSEIRSIAEYVKMSFPGITFSLKNSSDLTSLEYIEGTASKVFEFIVKGGTEFTSLSIDKGYRYGGGNTIYNTYTSSQITSIKNAPLIEYDPVVRIRPHILAWDAIKYIGNLTLRDAFFDDKAYFVNFLQTALSSDHQIVPKLNIDYGIPSAPSDPASTYEEVLGISANADQGQNYVISSQSVRAENYEFTVSLSDTPTQEVGYPVQSGYPDRYNEVDSNANADRNSQVQQCALNILVKNYKPSDCISYKISEVSESYISGTISQMFDTIEDLDEWYDNNPSAPVGSIVYVINTSPYNPRITSPEYLMLKSGTPNYWESVSALNERHAKYYPYTSCNVINDAQNGISLYNAPLALTTLIWPECITELVWGNPEFQDTEGQMNQTTHNADNAIQEGGADINISDKWATKLSIGNQSLSQIDDEWTDFTGIAIVKNKDADIYEIRGMRGGILQARFNSDGAIEGGGGAVILDSNGLYAKDGGVAIRAEGLVIEYDINTLPWSPSNTITFREKNGSAEVDTTRIGVSSNPYNVNAQIVVNGAGTSRANQISLIAKSGPAGLGLGALYIRSGSNNTTSPGDIVIGSLTYRPDDQLNFWKSVQVKNTNTAPGVTGGPSMRGGYEKLPSGVMIQFGAVYNPSDGMDVLFPAPFVSTGYDERWIGGTPKPFVQLTSFSVGKVWLNFENTNDRKFTIQIDSPIYGFSWMAIGRWI